MGAARRITGTILILLALVLCTGFGFLVYDQSSGGTVLGLDADLAGYLLAGTLGAIILVLVLLIVWHHKVRKARAAEQVTFEEPQLEAPPAPVPEPVAAPAPQLATVSARDPLPAAPGPQVVVYDLPTVQPAYRSWERGEEPATYTFPRSVRSAVYTNDHLDVGQGRQLKLRTLLAGPSEVGALDPLHAKPVTPQIVAADVPEPYRSKLFKSGVPSTGQEPSGEAFVAELEEARKAAKPRAPAARPYYGYPGDVHPVEDIEGIGAIYGDKLRKAGVFTTDRLLYEKSDKLADKVGVPRKTVETWQHMAELVRIKGVGPQYAEAMARAGVQGIGDLKRRRADTLTAQVNSYLDSLNATVVGTAITEKRVEGWKKAAEKMQRVKLQVPEQ
jgi:predicted flap endonuclease-1-like 5' DNA nuclease